MVKEIVAIGHMIEKAKLLMAVRKEVADVMKDGFVVTDGQHGNSDYAVVVRCGKEGDDIARRIKSSMPNVDIDRIADDMLGVRKSRRNR